MFAGALVLIVGALAAGSGYGWGTVKTVALQGPGRLASLTGTFAALTVFVVALVAALFALDVGVSLLVATTESQPVVWPAAGDLAQAFGGGVLVMLMWTYAGVLVGTLARGPALAVGLGLVWVLAVENLLRGVGTLWSPIERVTDVLPGTAAGSLAGALGATPVSEPGGTPGVLTTLDGGQAVPCSWRGRRRSCSGPRGWSADATSPERPCCRPVTQSGGSTVRGATGVATTNELVVWPCMRKRSRTASRSSMAGTCTLSRKQSSPEIRWHSLTSGVRCASSATLGS